jgi:hypothetical protein
VACGRQRWGGVKCHGLAQASKLAFVNSEIFSCVGYQIKTHGKCHGTGFRRQMLGSLDLARVSHVGTYERKCHGCVDLTGRLVRLINPLPVILQQLLQLCKRLEN